MATAYDGNFSRSRFRSSVLPTSPIVRPPSRFHSAVLPVSPMTPTPPMSSSKPRRSAVASASLESSYSSPVSQIVSVSPSTPTWHPLSPSSPEPTRTMNQIRCFLAARSDAPASSKYRTAIQKLHNISMSTYQAIMREIFPGDDAHPQHARYSSVLSTSLYRSYINNLIDVRINYYSDGRVMIITLPGLPHELMATFDNDMRQSLVLQGFLWPSWKSQWLKSCGAARISLAHGRTRREMEPDGGLQILSQKLPFLLVEVADSQEYADVLEKASWMLKHSKGKIRFAILIKLVRLRVKKTTNNKRPSHDVDFSPRPITKRVRTLLSEDEDLEIAACSAPHDSIDGCPNEGVDSESSDLSSVTSHDSIDSSTRNAHAIEDVKKKSTAPTRVHELSSPSSDLSSVDSNDSLILATPAIEIIETKSTETIPAVEVSSPRSDLSSVDSRNSINSPPQPLNTFPGAVGSSIGRENNCIGLPPLTEPLAITSARLDLPSTLDNPRAAFSSAFVTVLTSSVLTGARREVSKLLDCIEFWPRRPGPEDIFSFGWEDMPGLRYPEVMEGKRFTISFEDLHDTLEVFVRTTDPEWVRGNEEHLMGEWSDEGDSEETKESEGSEEVEEADEEERVQESESDK